MRWQRVSTTGEYQGYLSSVGTIPEEVHVILDYRSLESYLSSDLQKVDKRKLHLLMKVYFTTWQTDKVYQPYGRPATSNRMVHGWFQIVGVVS